MPANVPGLVLVIIFTCIFANMHSSADVTGLTLREDLDAVVELAIAVGGEPDAVGIDTGADGGRFCSGIADNLAELRFSAKTAAESQIILQNRQSPSKLQRNRLKSI